MKNLYVFTYREEFTCDIYAENEKEARKLLIKTKWEMLGNPHEDFLTIEKNPE